MAGRKGLKTVLLHRIAAFLVLREIAGEAAEILYFFLAFPELLECVCSNSGNSKTDNSFGETLDYDPNGNRMRKELTLVRLFTKDSNYYENTERLKTDGTYAYTYDARGNTVEKGNWVVVDGVEYSVSSEEALTYLVGITSSVESVDFVKSGEGVLYYAYAYDLLNRLVAVEKNGVLIREYRYGPDGLRTVSVNHMTGETTHYQYQSDNLVFEKNVTTDEIKSYVFGFGKHLARVDGTLGDIETDKYYYHQDHVGSIRAVTDKSGSVVWEGEYSAFGELLLEEVLDETFSDNIRFGGKPWDEETGLYYFNARYYDASTGRFISRDPIRDGLNWYVYCSNNPLVFVDPAGLEDYRRPSEEEIQEYEDAGIDTYWWDWDGTDEDLMYINTLSGEEQAEIAREMELAKETLELIKEKGVNTQLPGYVWEFIRDNGKNGGNLDLAVNAALTIYGEQLKNGGKISREVQQAFGLSDDQAYLYQAFYFGQGSGIDSTGALTAAGYNEGSKQWQGRFASVLGMDAKNRIDALINEGAVINNDPWAYGPNQGGQRVLSQGYYDREAAGYQNYWTDKAPETSTPYSTYRRYTKTGDIKQVTTYDEHGRRNTQYDLIDNRRQEHKHTFNYSNEFPLGIRDEKHLPLE